PHRMVVRRSDGGCARLLPAHAHLSHHALGGRATQPRRASSLAAGRGPESLRGGEGPGSRAPHRYGGDEGDAALRGRATAARPRPPRPGFLVLWAVGQPGNARELFAPPSSAGTVAPTDDAR